MRAKEAGSAARSVPARQVAVSAEGRPRRSRGVQHLFGMGQEGEAVHGQRRSPGRAVHEPRAEPLLERPRAGRWPWRGSRRGRVPPR
jgi:hypothetical protein